MTNYRTDSHPSVIKIVNFQLMPLKFIIFNIKKKLKLGVNILIHLNIPRSDCGHLEKLFHDFFKLPDSEQPDSMAYETVVTWIKKTETEFLVCCSDHIKIDRLSREKWKLTHLHFVELPWVQQNHEISKIDIQRDSWLLMSMYKALNICSCFYNGTSGWF